MAEIKGVTYHDFSGGMNAVTNPYDLKKNQMPFIRNMILDEHGSLRTRDGYSVSSTSPTNDAIVNVSAYTSTLGSSIPIAITKGASYNTLYNAATNPYSALTTMTNAYEIPLTANFNNQLIVFNGYETPFQTDAVTTTRLTGSDPTDIVPVGACHAASHLSSLWVWNTAATSSATAGPSSIQMSDVNNQNSWPVANQGFIAKDDGQVGMGLTAYTIAETGISPTATLMAFKNFSSYQILGAFGSSNFSIQRTKSDLGCTAPRTIQFCTGFGVIRMTHKGFALYNGVEDKLVSEPIRPYIFGTPEITGIDLTRITNAWATQSTNPPLYIAACSMASTGLPLTRIFIFDLVRTAWTICDYPINIQCLNLMQTGSQNLGLYAGESAGTGTQIFQLFNNDTTDNGSAIEWQFTSRTEVGKSPLENTFFRRVVLNFQAFETTSISVDVTVGNEQLSTVTRTLTSTSTPASWGTGVWGSFAWSVPSKTMSTVSIDINRTGQNAFIEVTGTKSVRLRGIEWHVKPKPLNRMSN